MNLQYCDVDVPDAFTTKRLLLRRVSPGDAAVLFDACMHGPEVTRFLSWRQHAQAGETAALISEMLHQWEIGKAAHWSLVPGEGTDAIGMLSLRLEMHANISYFLSREYWGKGLMAEAVLVVASWALQQAQIDRVWAFADVENTASHRVLEKCGFLSYGVMPHYAVFPNLGPALRDCLRYALTR